MSPVQRLLPQEVLHMWGFRLPCSAGIPQAYSRNETGPAGATAPVARCSWVTCPPLPTHTLEGQNKPTVVSLSLVWKPRRHGALTPVPAAAAADPRLSDCLSLSVLSVCALCGRWRYEAVAAFRM